LESGVMQRKIGVSLLIGWLVFIFILTVACSTLEDTKQGATDQETSGFTFKAPPGYRTIEYEDLRDSWMEADNLLFAQKKPVYFVLYRRDLPADSSLDKVFEQHLAKEEPQANHYQMVSRKEVRVFDRAAIEYTFAHFHGEPYVRTRETWLQHGGDIYILACSQTISADDASGPVSGECDRLLESFQFH
jgi:hypothetical protein